MNIYIHTLIFAQKHTIKEDTLSRTSLYLLFFKLPIYRSSPAQSTHLSLQSPKHFPSLPHPPNPQPPNPSHTPTNTQVLLLRLPTCVSERPSLAASRDLSRPTRYWLRRNSLSKEANCSLLNVVRARFGRSRSRPFGKTSSLTWPLASAMWRWAKSAVLLCSVTYR